MPTSYKEFEMVNSFFSLSGDERRFVACESENKRTMTLESIDHFSHSWLFSGLRHNGELMCFVSYSSKGGECRINRIWGKPLRAFIQKYNVTPATYLVENLLRSGIKVFSVVGFTKKGELFFSKKIRNKLIKRKQMGSFALGFAVMPKWKKICSKRPRLHI